MFHCIIIERKKFGAIGFSNSYNFNESDLETSITFLKNLILLYDEVPYEALTYMIGNIVYGGRITDFWDHRVLLSTLDKFCNKDIV